MNSLAAQLAVAAFRNPANPVRNEQDARNLALWARAAAREIEEERSEEDIIGGAIELQRPAGLSDEVSGEVSGEVNANTIADALGVSAGTVRRAIRGYEEVFGPLERHPSTGRKALPRRLTDHIEQAVRAARTDASDRSAFWMTLQ